MFDVDFNKAARWGNIAAAEVCRTLCSSKCMQPPAAKPLPEPALIYNLTWIEFILLRVDDQGKAEMERGGRAFQPHFWYKVLLCHSLWYLSFSSLLIFFFFIYFISLTQTQCVSLLFSLTYCTIVHNSKQMQNEWVKNKLPRHLCNVQ